MKGTQVLILNFDAARSLVRSLCEILQNAGSYEFRVTEQPLRDGNVEDVSSNTNIRDEFKTDLVILCLSGGSFEAIDPLLGHIRKWLKTVPIVLAMESAEIQSLYELLKSGVADFLVSPFKSADVIPRMLRLHQHSINSHSPVNRLKEMLGLEQFVGESEVLLKEIKKIPKIAQCDASALIGGETGTGKEMVARAIHYLSPRSGKAFIPINCGAIPTDLVENELFGHEAGAFTGATSAAPGILFEADKGTLFLDEVDSLPFASQVKLLRVLQDKEYRPLGARKSCKVDVRIIAASNGCFEEMIGSGKFRADLFYRLNVISMLMPPLRRRKEDIPLLARHLVAKYAAAYHRNVAAVSDGALRKLISHNWPGNIRELENVIASAVVISESSTIQPEEIQLPVSASIADDFSFRAQKARAVTEFETSYVRRLLIENHGNITKAASAARKHRRAFWQLMQKHSITLSLRS